MKKSKAGGSVIPTPPLSSKAPPSESGSTGSTTPRKGSSADKGTSGKAAAAAQLHKGNYLSKSQDNLASQLRKKANQAKGASSNKENTVTFKTPAMPSKVAKMKHGDTKVRSQSVDESASLKRAQSAQNITKPQPSNQNIESNVKRASSTQNINSNGKGGVRQVRISNPVNIMAYNAELLASFEKEKQALERRISELIQVTEKRKNEIATLKFEVKAMKEKVPSEDIQDELEMLRAENCHLKERLEEMGVPVEPVTDSEKLNMLKKSASSDSNLKGAIGGETESIFSRGAKDYTDSLFSRNMRTDSRAGSADGILDLQSVDSECGLSMGDLSCITPEHPSSISLENSNWDKMSNKSTSSNAMSEVSVVCLQDRIMEMQETHYSTNEELQATLQELVDLQDAVNELSQDNERLADERQVLLESLCAQTEKLENCRMQIEHLKALLVSESEGGDRSENERQLVGLIRSAHEEREEMMLRLTELNNHLHAYESEHREMADIVTALRDKSQILEMKNESVLGDKRSLESTVVELKETVAKESIELQRYKTLYDNEKGKVTELEQYRNVTDKTDLEELLDHTRQAKEKVESRLTNVQEELAVTLNNVAKQQDAMSTLEEELKVSKNNAKKEVSDLVYQLENMSAQKEDMGEEQANLRDHIDQLETDCERYLDQQKSGALNHAKLEQELKETRQRMLDMELNIEEARDRFTQEKEEWNQFQADLQTAVVIANDMKTEQQQDTERFISENYALKDRNRQLNDEIHSLSEQLESYKDRLEATTPPPATPPSASSIRSRVLTPLSPLDRELQSIRHTRKMSEPNSANQNLCVKNIIASIEHQGGVQTSIELLHRKLQVKTERGHTPPTSPAITSTCSSRRNSMDSPVSLSGSITDSPGKSQTTAFDRRSSMPAESHLKSVLRKPNEVKESRSSPLHTHRHTITNIIYDKVPGTRVSPDDNKQSPPGSRSDTDNSTRPLKPVLKKSSPSEEPKSDKHLVHGMHGLKADPLANLCKQTGGSKRNALLKWCQSRTASFSNIDITNFSSSWNDGLAFCAIMYNYQPETIPYNELNTMDKRRNFSLAFKAAESVGIPCNLQSNDMVAMERPDWQAVMCFITNIYKHFEVDAGMHKI